MQVEIKAEERNEFSASADIETSRALGERERSTFTTTQSTSSNMKQLLVDAETRERSVLDRYFWCRVKVGGGITSSPECSSLLSTE